MAVKRSHKGKGLFAGYLPLTVATTVSSAIALIGHVALALAYLALAILALAIMALTILALALTILALALAVVHAVLKKKRENKRACMRRG